MIRTKWKRNLVLILLGLLLAACSLVGGAETSTGEKAKIDSVEISAEDGDPPEYIAVVTGLFPDGCTEIGDTEQEVEGKTIKVTVYTQKTQDGPCPDLASVPFEEEIPLDVSGLEAGSYGVEVNGAVNSFTLSEDQP